MNQDGRLFVGNLAWTASEGALKDFFEDRGIRVVKVNIPMDKERNQARGFGFVTLADPSMTAIAIEKTNGMLLGGRVCAVKRAEPLKKQLPDPARRTAEKPRREGRSEERYNRGRDRY